MVRLRELRKEDALPMLEWMHDPDIQKCFKKNMMTITQEQAEKFICNARIPEKLCTGDSIHWAITDDTDEYLGTISLKDIDVENATAEYAVTTRRIIHGKGVAFLATGEVLKKAFREYGLHRVYLNVYADNIPAIKLYERCGFTFEGEFREHFCHKGKYENWKWYAMLNYEFDENRFDGRKNI